MSFKVKFTESDQTFKSRFGEVIQLDPPVILAKEITANGVYNASTDDASGYNPVTVNVDMTEAFNEGYNKATEENPFYYAQGLSSVFQGANFPENYNVVIKVRTLSSTNSMFSYAFNNCTGAKTIKLISEERERKISMVSSFAVVASRATLEIIDLTEFYRKPTALQIAFQNQKKLKSILGALDLTDCTNAINPFNGCSALENIEFVANTIKISISFSPCTKLSKASIESIVNGLNSDVTEQTLTLSKTAVNNSFTDTEWEALKNTKSNWTINLS